MESTPPSGVNRERRAATRFPLTLQLRYSIKREGMGAEVGSGQTIDASRAGLRFTADRPLAPGLQVALFIDWPVLLDGSVRLQLFLAGTVLRSNGTETALQIHRHTFTTRGRGLKQPTEFQD
jgi:hypothetical protein